MSSKINLELGTALVGIALCFIVDCSLAQEALDVPAAASDGDDMDGRAGRQQGS